MAESRAFGQAFGDVIEHQIPVFCGDERAEIGVRIHRVARLDIVAGAFQQTFDKARVQIFMNKHPGAVGADLTLGVEVADHGGGIGVLEIRIVKDDQR